MTAAPRRVAPIVGRWLLCALCVCGCVTINGQDADPGGVIRIGVLTNGSYEVVTLPLETYVARVLTGEALPGSDPAALEALAVAIRTYAVGNRGRHRTEGFDLCDQTHCQVMRASTIANERAALATAGQVLLFHGMPATVYYSASCGGHTEKPSNVWPGAEDPPYLPSREDDGCGGAPEWSTELGLVDLQRALQASGFRGRLRNVQIGSRNDSGRVALMTLDGMTPSSISGQELRASIGRTLGSQYLQSTVFDLSRSGDAFRFKGRGAGHGVGMCVIGSVKLAQSGESARQILTRYFPGTEIGNLGPRLTAVPPERPSIGAPAPVTPSIAAAPSTEPAPSTPSAASAPPAAPARPAPPAAPVQGVIVSLPQGYEGERLAVATMIARERDDLARTLEVAPPANLSARFYPTTDAYERATNQPWFTLGSTFGSDLHFVPLATLRERGVLERAVRHQIVHVLTDAVYAGRSAWVREGAAVHFSEGSNGPPAHDFCPQDNELLRPASISALTDAYARARACFERQLAGRPWTEVH